jgi:uncharacterized protein
MKRLQVENVTRGVLLGDSVGLADGFVARLRGLLGRDSLADGEGLLLVPCRAVHMHRMRFGLDVAFLDRGGRLLACYERLAPGERTGWHLRSRAALELPEGTLRRTGTRPGDRIVWSPAGAAGPGRAGRGRRSEGRAPSRHLNQGAS